MSVQHTPPFTRSQTGLTTSHSSTNTSENVTSDHPIAELQPFAPAPTQSAVHAAISVETAEQRNQRFETEMAALRESIAALSANQNSIQQSIQSSQNQTNQLITTLINAQQNQNVLNAQHNATANSFVNIRPPEPIQRASDARGKARQPNDFNGSPDENAENWIREMQMYLELSNENPNQWVKLAASYLQKDASLWWNAYLNSVLLQNYSTIKWEEFVEAF